MDYKEARKKIVALKKKLSLEIERNQSTYINAILREIENRYIRKYGVDNVDENILKRLINELNIKLPNSQVKMLTSKITGSQQLISEVWQNYLPEFENVSSVVERIGEQLQSVHSVDMPSLEPIINASIKTEFKRAIAAGYGYDTIRTRLRNSGMGYAAASTLANTAIAQYDNDVLVKSAEEAGINYFLYDGDISDNTRRFCREHLKRVYTIEELKKMDNGQALPVDTSLGGYNCQHYLTPLFRYNRVQFGEKYNPAHFKKGAA